MHSSLFQQDRGTNRLGKASFLRQAVSAFHLELSPTFAALVRRVALQPSANSLPLHSLDLLTDQLAPEPQPLILHLSAFWSTP